MTYMSLPLLFSNSAVVELKCAGCDTLVDWGVTTEYQDALEDHVCLSCGTRIN